MDSKVSKIENIIAKQIADETAKSIHDLEDDISGKLTAAIERINSVYTSAISALKQLELTDANMFDFFEKTDGNIRIEEVVSPYNGAIVNVQVDGRTKFQNNPISLKGTKRYKLILMAIEINTPLNNDWNLCEPPDLSKTMR